MRQLENRHLKFVAFNHISKFRISDHCDIIVFDFKCDVEIIGIKDIGTLR